MATVVAGAALEQEFQRLLARGGEAAARGDLEPAREALEDALAIRSRDPQVLGLLGQVFYRLARYDDAAIAWQRLVDDNPVEPGARVNLGLAWLKARQYEEAIKQLTIALDLNPDHRKAAGYLGLAWLELGRPGPAREWFLRAGSDQMVARCDQLLAAPPAPVEAPGLASPPSISDEPPREVALEQLPDALPESPEASAALSDLPPEPPATDETTSGPAVEAAAEPEPFIELSPPHLADVAVAPRAREVADPAAHPTLAGFAAARAVQGPAGQVFVAEGATLTVNVRGEVLCRLAGLAAWRGELAFSAEVKRFRGRTTEKPFGEPPEQMHRLVGEGLVVLRAAGRRFTVLELGGETGYFREAVVFGFQEAVAFENGRLPSPTGGLDLVHLRGHGRLVLVTRGEPVGVEVTPASPVHVPLASLVGWTGALAPRIAPLFAGGAEGEAVEISGEGRVLVDPGPSGRPGEGT
jgi:tetratricopeptide (TPR) repeat protein/uncharacterized protein (AIM24 family)